MKIGILGVGSMGSRHIKNFMQLGCDVVGYDPVKTPYSNYNEVMDCDAIVIAAPTRQHFGLIQEACAAKKPLLVEKPLVFTRQELESVSLTQVKMVGYNLRFHSCVKKVRRWLAEGLIGKPLWAHFTCAQFNDRPDYLRDGVILNWSHEIDLAIHLLGKVDVDYGHCDPKIAEVILRHDNSHCLTTIHLDYVTRPERRGFTIVGEDGMINADLIKRTAACRDITDNPIHGFIGDDNWDSNYLDEAAEFISKILGEVDPQYFIGCTAQEAYDVMDICLTAKDFNE